MHDRRWVVDIPRLKPHTLAQGLFVGLPFIERDEERMNGRLINRTLILLFAVCSVTAARSQYNWDIGVHVGGANYLGEMGGVEKPRRDFIWDMKLGQTRWCFGGFARRKINRLLSINAGLLYFRIQGADAISENGPRVGRNLNFRNDMFELYLRPEFTIFQDNDLGGRGRYHTDFRLFGYVGAALYYSTPKGQINRTGEFYSLRPLQTEAVSYSNLGFAVPIGVGFHFTIHRRHRIGWDFGWRTTFTDYLDDASTIYKNPILGNPDDALRQQLYDQRPYLGTVDLDPNTSGQQILNANGATVTIPGELQYGYSDSPGPSPNTDKKRGDPTHNDSYLTMTFTYSYVLRGQSNFYRQRYSWIRGKKRIGRKSRAKF